MSGSDRISGVIMLSAAIGLVVLWTRGQLNGLTASLTAAAQGKAQPRPIRFGPAPATLGGGGGEISA